MLPSPAFLAGLQRLHVKHEALAQLIYNMLGSNYTLKGVKVLIIRAVDTIEIGFVISDYLNVMDPYLNLLKKMKEKGQEMNKAMDYELFGINFKVELSGAAFYGLRLTCNDFIIKFMEKEMKNNPPVHVKFISGFLWSYGYKSAYEKFLDWFDNFGIEVIGNKISRIDMCCDSDENPFLESDLKGFVTRAKSINKEYDKAEQDQVNHYYKRFSGFSIGRGNPLLCRIYNKSIEISKSKKDWFKFIWLQKGWTANSEVWRIEYQLRRKVLKEFRAGSMESFIDKEDDIWLYLTKEWLVLRSPSDDNVSRWKVKRKWEPIQKCGIKYFAVPATREIIKKGNLIQLKDQAAGLMTSIAALENHLSFEETALSVAMYGEMKMIQKNTSFKNETNKRKHLYIAP